MNPVKRKIIAFFTFIGGLYFFLEFILPKKVAGIEFGANHEHILRGVQVIGVMAIGLGILSIVRVHGSRILKSSPGAFNSFALLFGFSLMLGFQISVVSQERKTLGLRRELSSLPEFIKLVVSEKSTNDFSPRLRALENRLAELQGSFNAELGANPERDRIFEDIKVNVQKLTSGLETQQPTVELEQQFSTAFAQLITLILNEYQSKQQVSLAKRGESLLTNGLFVPLGSAMFSLLAFYIASAAYRSFRVKSFESSLLMLTAVIVMLGQIPQGSIYISDSLPSVRLWLLKNVSTPAFRAIFFGSAIAGLAMAIRLWLSLDKGPLSEDEQ